MASKKRVIRHNLVREHRLAQYEKSLDLVLKGIATPEYVTERWNKLKEVEK